MTFVIVRLVLCFQEYSRDFSYHSNAHKTNISSRCHQNEVKRKMQVLQMW